MQTDLKTLRVCIQTLRVAPNVRNFNYTRLIRENALAMKHKFQANEDTSILSTRRKVRRSAYSVTIRQRWMNYSWDTDWDDTLYDDYGDPVDDSDFDDPDPVMPITLSLLRTMIEDDSQYAESDEWDFEDFGASPDDILDDLPPDEPQDPVIW